MSLRAVAARQEQNYGIRRRRGAITAHIPVTVLLVLPAVRRNPQHGD